MFSLYGSSCATVSVICAVVVLVFSGCSGITAADRYVSSEQFGDSGATRCGVVHEHPVLLEPCE